MFFKRIHNSKPEKENKPAKDVICYPKGQGNGIFTYDHIPVIKECIKTALCKYYDGKIHGKTIHDLVTMSITDLLLFFQQTSFTEYEKAVATRLLTEIMNRLRYLQEVGLEYLTLNRLSNTLSGGESQRINLATSL